MIRRLGSHIGKQIHFGYDRYSVPELETYRAYLSTFGEVTESVEHERLHYLTSAERTCRAVQSEPEAFGILCCGTGMGMSIAANKFSGIYAARCIDVEDASMSRTINNANVLCIAARHGFEANRDIIDTFITTAFTGRKLDELEYITRFEAPVRPVAKPRALRRTA